MNSHKHAALTPKGRALLVSRVLEEGWQVALASQAAGVSTRTGYKWLARFKIEGPAGLLDRSSRPASCPHETSLVDRQRCEQLRRQRLSSVAHCLGVRPQLGHAESTHEAIGPVEAALSGSC